MDAISNTTTTASPTVSTTVEKRVKQYIELRDVLKKMDDAHDEAKKPLVELQNLLTGWMQNFLEQAGADSVKTSEGTCYSTTRFTASLADPEAFMAFVKTTDNFDLLDRKANVTAVKDYVSENGTLPPGVNLSSIRTVGVRRASGK
jgi:hypothetical protein